MVLSELSSEGQRQIDEGKPPMKATGWLTFLAACLVGVDHGKGGGGLFVYPQQTKMAVPIYSPYMLPQSLSVGQLLEVIVGLA